MQCTHQILIHQLTFNLPNGQSLFSDLSHAFTQQKTGLVGRNGIGKSTLIKLIMGQLTPHSGAIQTVGRVIYVPQDPQIQSEMTVASFLGFADKIAAFDRIEQGSIDERDFTTLNEDWLVKHRLQEQLAALGLHTIPHDRPLTCLSGGEITRLLLTQAFFAEADFLILDEPTNHLDQHARLQLYETIATWQGGLIVISHDRALLNCMTEIVELSTLGLARYGGNYDAYNEQKTIETAARELVLQDSKKQLHKSKQTIQLTRERHEQKQSHGRKQFLTGKIDRMSANSKRGRSERSQQKMLVKEERLLNTAHEQLQAAQAQIEMTQEINVDLPATHVPNGKMIVDIEALSFAYPESDKPIINGFNFKLQGPSRIAVVGDNGSGKTTLIKLILGELTPQRGTIHLGTTRINYLDQNASSLNPNTSILENFMRLNPETTEFEAYHSLAQFLFRNVATRQLVKNLSGGEKLRALLACVLMSQNPPQLLILDEPTNHLDLSSIASIESALKNYQGAMIVISHDSHFLKQIGVLFSIHPNGNTLPSIR